MLESHMSLPSSQEVKVKVHTLDIAPLHSESPPLSYGTCSQGISQFYLHTHTFICNRNELYLPLTTLFPFTRDSCFHPSASPTNSACILTGLPCNL